MSKLYYSSSFIKTIPADLVTCCSYHQSYLLDIQKHADYYFEIYQHILDSSEKTLQQPLNESHLLDFGCGNGVLGLLALAKGWQYVSFMDMHPHCVQNVQALLKHYNVSNAGVFHASDTQLHEVFQIGSLQPNVAVNMNVIEHVYSLEEFCQSFRTHLPHTALICTTSGMQDNPLRSKPNIKLHIQSETKAVDQLQTTPNNPYAGWNFYAIRKDIISKIAQDKITTQEIETLAKRTRGLNKKDIEFAVENYLANKILPQELSHPTNTCDPISGSWTERLLTNQEYKSIFQNAGYKVNILPGYYDTQTNRGIKKLTLSTLNLLVKITNTNKYGAYILIVAQPI